MARCIEMNNRKRQRCKSSVIFQTNAAMVLHWQAVMMRRPEKGGRFMQIVGKRIPTGSRRLLPVFCIGIIGGILRMNLGKSIFLKETGLFDESVLYRMKYMSLDGNAFFYYVLRKRMLALILAAILATTYLGYVLCMGTAVWCGMSVGVYLSALFIRYGIKGLALALVGIFPQYLLFVPAILMLLGWCEGLYRAIYSRSGVMEAEGRSFVIKKLGWLGAIAGIVIAGCFLESYVNPALLIGYLKIF